MRGAWAPAFAGVTVEWVPSVGLGTLDGRAGPAMGTNGVRFNLALAPRRTAARRNTPSIAFEQALQIVDLGQRARRLAEAAAQLVENLAGALHVDGVRHFDRASFLGTL